MAHILVNEPVWVTLQENDRQVHVRPLLGSELFIDQLRQATDGAADPVTGVTFNTTLTKGELESRLVEAVARLRFVAPLIAATVESRSDNNASELMRSWVYSPPSSVDELLGWAKQVVEVFDFKDVGGTAGAFIQLAAETIDLPHKLADGSIQHTKFYLLLGEEDSSVHGLFIYGTHSIWDAYPAIKSLRFLLEYISDPDASPTSSLLPWGKEDENLPPGPFVGSGKTWEDNGFTLLQGVGQVVMNPEPSQSLVPQRSIISRQGYSVRALARIDAATSRQLVLAVKALGVSITNLIEAAQVLATYDFNSAERRSHLTYDFCLVDTTSQLVEPWKTKPHITSSLTALAVMIPLSVHETEPTTKQKLLAILSTLSEQYKPFLSHPNFPHVIAAQVLLSPITEPFPIATPHAGIFTNVGDVDRRLRSKWNDVKGREVIALTDFAVGHRYSGVVRPTTHCWTFGGEIQIQVQGADIWDAEYLQEYSEKIARNAKEILCA